MGPLASDHRGDFERRLLALARSELDAWDKDYPDGYGIGRIAILYEVIFPPTEGDELKPWAHSWSTHSSIDYRFSDSSFWAEIAMLRDVLEQVENARWRPKDEDEEDGEEDVGEHDSEEPAT